MEGDLLAMVLKEERTPHKSGIGPGVKLPLVAIQAAQDLYAEAVEFCLLHEIPTRCIHIKAQPIGPGPLQYGGRPTTFLEHKDGEWTVERLFRKSGTALTQSFVSARVIVTETPDNKFPCRKFPKQDRWQIKIGAWKEMPGKIVLEDFVYLLRGEKPPVPAVRTVSAGEIGGVEILPAHSSRTGVRFILERAPRVSIWLGSLGIPRAMWEIQEVGAGLYPDGETDYGMCREPWYAALPNPGTNILTIQEIYDFGQRYQQSRVQLQKKAGLATEIIGRG